MHRTLSVVLTLTLSGTAVAQLDPIWTVTDPGLAAFSIAADPLDGVVAVGTTPSPADAVVRSYDGAGALRWSASLDAGLGLDDSFQFVRVAANGDVVAAGRRVGFVGPTYVWDVLLYRFDRQGNLLWSRAYDGPFGNRIDQVAALALAPDGSIVLAGASNGPAGSPDLCVWKYDAAGTLLWVATADGIAGLSDQATGVALDALGNVYACGASAWVPGAQGDVLVASFTPAGALRWTRESAGPLGGPETGRSIAVDGAGRVLVAATERTASDYAAVLRAFDAAGNPLWVRAPTDGSRDANQVVVTDTGEIVLLATNQDAMAITGITLNAFDGAGTLLWSRSRPRAHPHELLARAGGAVLVCGTAYEATTTIGSAYLARHERDGSEAWTRIHGTAAAGEDFLHLAPASGEGIYVAGWPPASLYLARWDPSGGSICYGDGLGTPCPCNNASAAGARRGCANSLGLGGRLDRQGTASLAADTLVLAGSDMPDASALYFQGTQLVAGGMGVPFGDGLRCVTGTVVRLATRTNAGGASICPDAGDPPLHVRGLVTVPGTRAYQVWYRNSAAFCTSATFNLTNAMLVSWAP